MIHTKAMSQKIKSLEKMSLKLQKMKTTFENDVWSYMWKIQSINLLKIKFIFHKNFEHKVGCLSEYFKPKFIIKQL